MNFLCPSCRTPLPRAPIEQVTCTGCGVQVDLTRAETAPGQARLWPEVDLSGETLGGFVLEKLLGTGGMGTVYEAHSPDGAKVALKVLAPLLAAEPELRERFRREARALTAITHRGVVKMLGEGEERSFCWYAMELVAGADLRTRLKDGPLTPLEVRQLARSLLEALMAVHAAGFVHRDLKPANVLLARDGPKLCDFGIARVEDASTLTASAAVMGSLRYMSPEQRWGKSDLRSDLYGLGVVLHEALALGVPGEKPLPASTPGSLARLIDALTQNSPDRRPQTALAALQQLEQGNRRARVLGAGAVATAAVIAGVLAVANPFSSVSSIELDAGLPLSTLTTPSDLAPATTEVDAGLPDAGAPDAGAEDAGVDGGVDGGVEVDLPFVAVKGPPPKGKPVKGLTKSLKLDDAALGAVLGKAPLEGKFAVEGTGAAKVYARGVLLGPAPGTFTTNAGGFLLEVVCDRTLAGGGGKKKKPSFKRFTFKAMARPSGSPPSYQYDCPEPE